MENNTLELAFSTLERDNTFISELVDTIPPSIFFNQEVADRLRQKLSSSDNTDAPAGKVTESKRNLSLDPFAGKTVTKIMESVIHNRQKARKKQRLKEIKKGKGTDLYSAALSRASNIDELRQRLTEKIEKLKGGRDSEKVFQRHKKQAEKKRSERKRPSTGNLRKPDAFAKVNGDVSMEESRDSDKKEETTNPEKPVYNKDKKMLFSKFDFATSVIEESEKQKKQEKLHGLKAYKKKVQKLEKEKEKLEQLEEVNPEKAKVVKDKAKWRRAIDMAEGLKLKDDPELLKKTIKRREKLKKRSAKKWEARKNLVAQKQQERQAKRRENIKRRKQQKTEKKIKRLQKKGRVIPGF